MGYEMYRQLTYTRADKPTQHRSVSQTKKQMKILSEEEEANISQYRQCI